MYPAQFFGLFPPFPRDDKVFVAMSFAASFEPRWHNVLKPAAQKIIVNGSHLSAHRVNMGVASDSILTQILDGIARCRTFVADISVIAEVDSNPLRNANVLYEVGLAHAVRLPQEVLLFRSDDRQLMFDVANIRVNRYDPDGAPDAAKAQVAAAILSGLREVELQRHLAVRRAAQSLDYPGWMLLAEAQGPDGVRHPIRNTVGQVLDAIERANAVARLLDLGALSLAFTRMTPEVVANMGDQPSQELVRYHSTPFGAALFAYCAEQQGLLDPEIEGLLKAQSQLSTTET
jgi:hypothetical protein